MTPPFVAIAPVTADSSPQLPPAAEGECSPALTAMLTATAACSDSPTSAGGEAVAPSDAADPSSGSSDKDEKNGKAPRRLPIFATLCEEERALSLSQGAAAPAAGAPSPVPAAAAVDAAPEK